MTSYSETLDYIYNLRGGIIDLRLERMERALALFEHPERRFPALHIAGTNGKGSTAAMLHSILLAQGYKVGRYTSPHLVSFAERILIGEEEISPEEVVALAEEIKGRLSSHDLSLTFFEFVTLMALVYFGSREVDVAVVEVGMGGRLDATNLVLPSVSIITTISKDHEAYLGSDTLSIAREKGGIIKKGVPVVGGVFPADVAELLAGLARARDSLHYFLGRDFKMFLKSEGVFDYTGLEWHLADLSVALRGKHQGNNAALALCALEVVREKFPVGEASVRQGLQSVIWPGRFEVVLRRPTVILDGAHNSEGVGALVEEIKAFEGGKKVRLLFASMVDKDWPSMLTELASVASEGVLTRAPVARSAEPGKMVEVLQQRIPVRVIEDPNEGMRYLLDTSSPEDVLLVAGSLYLLGEVRPMLRELATRKSIERESLDSAL